MLVLHALLVIFHVCVSLLVKARLRRIEDVERTRWSPEVKKTGAGEIGIEQGYNHQRMEASPNTHLFLPSTLHAIP